MDGRGCKRQKLDVTKVSTVNSAINLALAGGESFTGEWEDVSEYATITVHMTGTAESAVNGLQLTTSINADVPAFTKSVSVSAPGFRSVHSLAVTSKYFRMTYVNGPDPSILNLQIMYGKHRHHGLVSTTSQVISDANDTTLYRVVNDHMLDLSRGVVSDKTAIHKFATTVVDAKDVFQSCWGPGGLYPFPATAQLIRVKAGGNAADDQGGTGAEAIVVEGLDADWNQISDTLGTFGASVGPVSQIAFLRVSRVYVIATGSTQTNVGNIDIENVLGVTLGHIEAGFGQSQMAQFTVPAGHTAFLTRIQVSVDAKVDKNGSARLHRFINTDLGAPKRLIWRSESFRNPTTTRFVSLVSLGEKEDIDVHVTADTNGSSIHVNYDIVIVDNRR